MKAKYLFAMGLGALMMTACSSDEPMVNTTPSNPDGNFMAIRIADGAASKADVEFDEGTPDEKNIDYSKLRFFFFDAAGNAYQMQVSETEISNMVKPLITENDDVNDKNDKGTKTAVIVLQNPAATNTAGLPAKVVAVANADSYGSYENKSLTQLLDAVESNYKTADNAFIMTSASSWENGENNYWSNISGANVCATRQAAIDNPVIIYVERIIAKVGVDAFPASNAVYADANATTGMKIQLNTPTGLQEKSLYVKPMGWTLNTLASSAYGIKHVADFTSNFAAGSAWNVSGRTYWETSNGQTAPEVFTPATAFANAAGAAEYVWPNTNDATLSAGTVLGGRQGLSNYALSNATKILVGVKVFATDGAEPAADAEGTHIMKFAGSYYTPEALCNALKTAANPYICFARNSDKQYTVSFFPGTAENHGTLVATPAGEMIANVPTAEYWAGMGYYILNVSGDLMQKEDTEKPAYGIVRNQVYKYNLQKFIGLGTPVVNPDAENVLPENPTSSESFIAARLNVYKWRVISQSANLE